MKALYLFFNSLLGDVGLPTFFSFEKEHKQTTHTHREWGQRKGKIWVVPHRLRVSSKIGIKPSYTLQELPAFVVGKLCDIMPLSPFPLCVCVLSICVPSQKKKRW